MLLAGLRVDGVGTFRSLLVVGVCASCVPVVALPLALPGGFLISISPFGMTGKPAFAIGLPLVFYLWKIEIYTVRNAREIYITLITKDDIIYWNALLIEF